MRADVAHVPLRVGADGSRSHVLRTRGADADDDGIPPTRGAATPVRNPHALLTMQRVAGNRAVNRMVELQRGPDEPSAEPAATTATVDRTDPLLEEEMMAAVAREGARQLDAYLTTYMLSCHYGNMSLSTALATGRVPQFSKEYENTIAAVRAQALAALHEAKGYLEGLDAPAMRAWGGAALDGVNVAITAISDGNDIVFVIDTRTPEGRAAVAHIEHFAEQVATRERGFVDEEGRPSRVSAGASAHEGTIDDEATAAQKVEHRSVSVLDIGALYDNRAIAHFEGPVLDPPGRIIIDTAAAVDLRALFIHEVGGHALDVQSPAERETLASGGRLSESQQRAHTVRMEGLVDNMVDKVAFLTFIRDDLPRDLVRRISR